MKTLKIKYLILAGLMPCAIACVEQKDTELERPEIELLSPVPCDTLYFGEDFHFTLQIRDNTGLGQVSTDIHHNFGHHDHGAHETCQMDPSKEAVNPWSESWLFRLPDNERETVFDTVLMVPGKTGEQLLFDTGDYHFHIYCTDNEGYQSFTTLDVKIRYR